MRQSEYEALRSAVSRLQSSRILREDEASLYRARIDATREEEGDTQPPNVAPFDPGDDGRRD